MDSIKKYIRGYVRIRLESPAPDRFFSLCVHNRIPLRNLTQEASFYEMELSARDFLRLGRFRRKTDARIHILSKNVTIGPRRFLTVSLTGGIVDKRRWGTAFVFAEDAAEITAVGVSYHKGNVGHRKLFGVQ